MIKDATEQEMFQVKMKGNSFSLDPMKEENAVLSAKASTTEVWHKRLGHYHYQGLILMKKLNIIRDLLTWKNSLQIVKIVSMESKIGCHFISQHGELHKKLMLVYTNFARPFRTPSLKSSLYYIIFIDDLTRMCWIFFLKSKSKVTGVFWKFKARVENESGCKIQSLRIYKHLQGRRHKVSTDNPLYSTLKNEFVKEETNLFWR